MSRLRAVVLLIVTAGGAAVALGMFSWGWPLRLVAALLAVSALAALPLSRYRYYKPRVVPKLARLERSRTSVLDTRQGTIGDLVTRHNLAVEELRHGNVNDAIEMLIEVDLHFHQKLGASHPITLIGRHNISIALLAQGRLSEPVALHEHVLEALEASPHDKDPILDTMEIRKLFDITVWDQSRPPDETPPSAISTVQVTIYLSDQTIHRQVESAVDEWLATAGLEVTDRGDPVLGSWFRRIRAGARNAAQSPLAHEIGAAALHTAEAHLVHAKSAEVTAKLMQHLGPVLTALQPTPDAAIRAGALLILKVNWVVTVHQLTVSQQLLLDHHPQLVMSPQKILAVLGETQTGLMPMADAGGAAAVSHVETDSEIENLGEIPSDRPD